MIHNSGIGVYIREYINYIVQEKIFDKITLIGKPELLKRYFGQFSNWECVEADFPIYSITEQIKLPRLIPACDLFWSPHYNIPLFPIKARKRLVTVPDVFHLAHANTLPLKQQVYAKLVTNAAVKLSNKVVTISEYSAQEIKRLTGVGKPKVETVLLGLNTSEFTVSQSLEIQKQVKALYGLPDRYILFVGNVKPHKNLQTLVDAFSLLLQDQPDLYLLIAGKKEGFITGDKELFERIEKNETLAKRIKFSGYVDSEHLPVIYNMASLFVFPSLYEGFGFPPLEAMACGCPVVASNRASIPEVCGESAFYVDPTNPAEIAQGIEQVLTHKELRNKLIEKGFMQVQKYKWKDSDQHFVRIIKSMI
ncbi:glycosyltransferase family 4 protein [Spirosoma sp. KUDC1026]|uniref:glycosyltransferase family 4 protein n=1 Tax=Spirosoma sp. KUDC1026 TaxID=2745947 RepID=UPI001E295DC1|nr:glycosyltransferase family 1 protein [Spirosoma sp. KUDC1026]